jgi:hypothetical protein
VQDLPEPAGNEITEQKKSWQQKPKTGDLTARQHSWRGKERLRQNPANVDGKIDTTTKNQQLERC